MWTSWGYNLALHLFPNVVQPWKYLNIETHIDRRGWSACLQLYFKISTLSRLDAVRSHVPYSYHILYIKRNVLTDTAVCVPPFRVSDRRSRHQAVPWPHGRVSGHCYPRRRRGKAQVRGSRAGLSSKKRPLNLIQCDCLCLSPDSVTGWLTMKVVLYAVRLGPCGGWSLSESGDCPPLILNLCQIYLLADLCLFAISYVSDKSRYGIFSFLLSYLALELHMLWL